MMIEEKTCINDYNEINDLYKSFIAHREWFVKYYDSGNVESELKKYESKPGHKGLKYGVKRTYRFYKSDEIKRIDKYIMESEVIRLKLNYLVKIASFCKSKIKMTEGIPILPNDTINDLKYFINMVEYFDKKYKGAAQ